MSPRAPGDEVPRRAHERLWLREGFEWWDAVWDRMDPPTRRLFVDALEADGSMTDLAPAAHGKLAAQGLVVALAGRSVVAPRAREFARRIAHLARFSVLRDPDPCVLVEHLRASCDEEGLRALCRLVTGSTVPRRVHPADVVGAAIAEGTWQKAGPRLASRSGGGGLLLAHLAQARAPRLQVDLAQALGERGWADGLDALLALLLAFEGLEPGTLRLEVGLGPPRIASLIRADPGIAADADDSGDAGLDLDDLHDLPPLPVVMGRPSLHASSPVVAASASSASAPSASAPSKAKRKRGKKEAEAPASEEAAPASLACNGAPPLADGLPPPDPVAPLVLDCEELLVHLAGERVRLTRSGQIYAEQAERIEASLAARPSRLAPARRLDLAVAVLSDLELLAQHDAGQVTIIRPAPAAVRWLARPVAARQRELCELARSGRVARWLGGPLEFLAERVGPWPQEQGSLERLVEPLRGMAPGRAYDLGAVLLPTRGEHNPLLSLFASRLARLGRRPLDTPALLRTELRWVFFEVASEDPLVVLDRRYAEGIVAALDWLEHLGGARLALRARSDGHERLDVVRPAKPGEHQVVASLSPLGRWHLGFEAGPPPSGPEEPAPRVVVQPNLEVLVIGRAPAACCSLARFAVGRAGESGPARTFTLDRDRVIEAVAEGMTPAEIEAALVETGGAVPDNVRRTVRDWAQAVRRARVVHVPVLVTEDEETALVIRAAAGKGVLVPGHPIPVDPAKLSAFKKALRKRGIVVD